MNCDYPRIQIPVHLTKRNFKTHLCQEAIEHLFTYILPPHFFSEMDACHRFHHLLPVVSWTPLETPPFAMTFFVCCRFRQNAFRFFYEMVSRWLIPGKRTNAILQFAVDFTMPEISDQIYIGGEVIIQIETAKELALLQKSLPILETELRMGLESEYHSHRILEIKGLSTDEKTALIQENIARLIKHRPQDFDYDIYSEMQHFLVLCKDSFKAAREYKHMSRIICTHYLFRKALKLSYETFPDRRYVSVKLIRASIEETTKKRKVLGIAIGMSFLRNQEVFAAEHILAAIQALLPDVSMVEGSFFLNTSRTSSPLTFYLEICKNSEIPFTLNEIKQLKQELPSELKNHIEQRHNPIFMPSNEEEILRTILSLSYQLKYVKDLPQVVINFSSQQEEDLEFLVIVLRVATLDSRPFFQLFEARKLDLDVVVERTKYVGNLRKKYQKEAAVLRVKVRKTPFLRLNRSVDLYKARQMISDQLKKVLGEFRDFNGGTISKETEIFSQLNSLLGETARENAFLLEDFFFSLSPAVMRSVLEPYPLKKLFQMLLDSENEGLNEDQPYQIRILEDSKYLYMILAAKEASFHEPITLALNQLKLPSLSLTLGQIGSAEFPTLGLIYQFKDPSETALLKDTVESTITQWGERLLSYI